MKHMYSEVYSNLAQNHNDYSECTRHTPFHSSTVLVRDIPVDMYFQVYTRRTLLMMNNMNPVDNLH